MSALDRSTGCSLQFVPPVFPNYTTKSTILLSAMVPCIRFFLLLLNLDLLSTVYAIKDSNSEAVKWLEAERSVLVYLATPDLYYCTSFSKLFMSYSHVSALNAS